MWICVLMKLSQLVYGEKIAGLHQAIIIKWIISYWRNIKHHHQYQGGCTRQRYNLARFYFYQSQYVGWSCLCFATHVCSPRDLSRSMGMASFIAINGYPRRRGRCSAAHTLGSTSSMIHKTTRRCFWDPKPQFLGMYPVGGSVDYGLSLDDLIPSGSFIDLRWGFWLSHQRT
jgi:hypothetical protein